MTNKGTLYVLSGPSGVGKGTVCKALLKVATDLCCSTSATTRKARVGEVEGVNYYFLEKEDFDQRVANNEFLEWANVYGNCYGTLKSVVADLLATGKDVILEIDTYGAKQIKEGDLGAILIYLIPPDAEELEARLRGRKTDSAEEIEKRLKCLDFEMKQIEYYDYSVVNHEIEQATSEVLEIINARRNA